MLLLQKPALSRLLPSLRGAAGLYLLAVSSAPKQSPAKNYIDQCNAVIGKGDCFGGNNAFTYKATAAPRNDGTAQQFQQGTDAACSYQR
ncbi:hypothetical protein [Pseudocnuella soli]|uniref:hypothetical protein n=1 Tax=Pseudocnuella soli TaxID=2502779 RepID=UPI001051831B|nr:hypothetical protein [Pseudocnuella soli]